DSRNPMDLAPVVKLVVPSNNASFPRPANIAMRAEALAKDGWITSVAFYQGADRLGTVTNAHPVADPTNLFHFVWSNAPAGSFVLTARATDSTGSKSTSAPVRITVGAPSALGFVQRALPGSYTAGETLT